MAQFMPPKALAEVRAMLGAANCPLSVVSCGNGRNGGVQCNRY